MIAIWKREFKSLFHSVIGWLFVAAILALYGLYFFAYNLSVGYPYISYTLNAVTVILLIAVPILTMRSLSEDRRLKIDQLTLTSPVSVGGIVLGKYLAMVSAFTIDIFIMGLTPLLLLKFGTVPLGEAYVALFGFWLYGCASLAVGMVISSLVESQVISAVLTFGALFVSYMMSSITGLISADGNLLIKVLNCFDLYQPFSNFLNGCLEVTAIVYYLSVIALLLFLTVQSIQKRRWSISKKKLSMGVFSTGFIVIAVAVTVVVNMLASSLPTDFSSFDLSYAKIYELTDDTKSYVKGLEEEVMIYVLNSESNKDTQIDKTLSRYMNLSKNISVTYVDPAKNPYFYQQYTDSTPTTNSLILVSGKRSRVIDYYDIYQYDYSFNYSTYSYDTTLTGYDAEGQLTSGLEYVTMDQEELPVVYVVSGHGETAIGSGFEETLEKANITMEDLDLFNLEAVPEDAQAIIINAPAQDFNEADAQKVIAYLQAGGKALISVNYAYPDLPNFESILAAYGVTVVEGVVADNSGQYSYNGNPFYLLPEVESTDYTASVSGSYIFAAASAGLTFTAPETADDTETVDSTETADDAETADSTETADDTEASEMECQVMLTTTENSVSKTATDNITTTEYEDGDIQGPFNVALAVTQDVGEETTQLVVYGSPLLLSDEADSIVSGNNATMFADVMGMFVDQTELSGSVIPVKELTLSNLTVSTAFATSFGIVMTIVLPIFLVVFGIVIWVMRRKR